jgi:hypothetical protein
MFFYISLARALKDSDPLITQELVDSINNNPRSTFTATLNPKFAKMTIGDAKRFLSPIRPVPQNHGSAIPVGANENFFHNLDKNYITGYTNAKAAKGNNTLKILYGGPHQTDLEPQDRFKFPVYDVTQLCSSWAAAVTSAMSISVSRWAGKFVNFSLQYVLDCDMLGDACIERTPLNAYQIFWERYPPASDSWDMPGNGGSERSLPTDPPRSDFTKNNCLDFNCYPGLPGCVRNWALTGSCNPGDPETNCPIYFLYNWRWIKSHLWEVGAVTSSIVVHPTLFTYSTGVYTSNTTNNDPIGMLDVTIIGWGQALLNLSSYDESYSMTNLRWWWVIPHFGDYLTTSLFTPGNEGGNVEDGSYLYDATSLRTDKNKELGKAVMKFNRRFDDCNIESHAVGAVPFNFIPHPWRTPEETP